MELLVVIGEPFREPGDISMTVDVLQNLPPFLGAALSPPESYRRHTLANLVEHALGLAALDHIVLKNDLESVDGGGPARISA